MPEVPSNLRADTELTSDPSVAGRFHADIPDDWKVAYVFGGVTMYTALRAMQEALGRPELSLEIGIRFVATPVTPWVLQEIEAWHVGDGYATGPARLWDEDGNLCAIATQTANLRLFAND